MILDGFRIYPIGCSDNTRYAGSLLKQAGFTLIDHPSPEITHLLLDVPSFDANGFLRDGTDLKKHLRMVPGNVTIIGGNLQQDYLINYQTMDLLKDPYYLAKNAAITAECALKVASPYLKTTFSESPALILGWGRIGKCLARLLSALNCPVSVVARKKSDRAILEALGYRSLDFSDMIQSLDHYRILFNTVPDLTLYGNLPDSRNSIIAIDLASYPGLQGDNIIPARGLPGKYAPESSGKLIADTILRLLKEETL